VPQSWLDLPVLLPVLLRDGELVAADIGLGLERVVLPRGDLNDVAFSARVRDGRLKPSAFAARFAGVTFAGSLGLDLRSAVPEVSLEMSTRSARPSEDAQIPCT
jgi:hypothetical protein